jgi:hypothetical protein
MKTNNLQDPPPPSPKASPRWTRLLVVACVFILFLGLRRVSNQIDPVPATPGTNAATTGEATEGAATERTRWRSRRASPDPVQTAEEIVAAKVQQFARKRRAMVHDIARRTGKPIPTEVEKFFDAIESGRWDEIEAQWKGLSRRSGQYENSTNWHALDPYWMSVLDAYGAAEQAHDWPAQKLLDYGNAILESLRPGMVYVGGTDNGRWVPELLNETSGGEPHIMVTQNALADGRYIEYVSALYGGQMTTLTPDDSQRAFSDYLEGAQKRLQHDQEFPDEPKQLRPGEDVRVKDGKVQVSGQVAVMAINERLLQMLMEKNPQLSFAVQESSPLPGTYADALPLGPLMELRAQDGQNTFTAERAAQSLDYWRNAAQQILADPEAAASETALKSYSHDAVSAANLLAAHRFDAEAEQAYRLATQLWPGNPEPVGHLGELLVRAGRENEARQLFDQFTRQYPDQSKDLERSRAAGVVIGSSPAAKR